MPFALITTDYLRQKELGLMKPHVILTPNQAVGRQTMWMLSIIWVVVFALYWALFRPVIFPSLPEIIQSLPNLWFQEGLGDQIISSLRVNIEALTISTGIGLTVAYFGRVPLVRPMTIGLSKLRILSPVVFFVPLLFVVGYGHWLKVWMLTLGEMFFIITSVSTIINDVPSINLDDARTLRMNEWQVLWYSIVRGSLPQVIDAIRDNAAMGVSMLIMVESIVRSEGGLGVLFMDQQKYRNFTVVYAIAGVLLLMGWLQDLTLSGIRRGLCPWAEAKR